jgi:MYXO-CTERM domain-containing protein
MRRSFMFASLAVVISQAGLAPAFADSGVKVALPAKESFALATTGAASHQIVVNTGDLGARIGASADVRAVSLRAIAAADPRAAGAILTETRHEVGTRDTVVHFSQTHLGLPVLGRGATVRYDDRGRAVQVSSSIATQLPASAIPGVSIAVAIRRYEEATGRSAASADGKLAFYTGPFDAARLVWTVLPPEDGVSPARLRLVVDAVTGEILERMDVRRHVGAANVFPTNPSKSPTRSLLPLMLPDTAGVLKNEFVQSYNCIDKKTKRNVSFSGFAFDAHTCELINIATPNAAGDYDVEPADVAGSAASKADAYSEVSMFYHASRAYAFFRELRGDAAAQVVRAKPFAAIANLQLPAGLAQQNLQKIADVNQPLEPFQNAFFSPGNDGGQGDFFASLYGVSGGGIWFGQGPRRDYAYDGDVVYHEFTHAVIDDTIQLGAVHFDRYGMTYAPGGMNEGLADYFSSALAGDPNVGEYASEDISQNSGVIRSLDNQESCPKDVFGEVHRDSTLFSGGLWSARQSLPEGDRRAFDAALYASMRAHAGDGDLDYTDLTKYFIATLKTALPAGATALQTEMTTRGVFNGCDRIFAMKSGVPLAGAVLQDDFGGWYATGKNTINIKSVPGIAQFSLPLVAKNGKLVIGFEGRDLGAGLGGFGGQPSPFKPQVLVRFAKPIEWKISGQTITATADTTVNLAAAADSAATMTAEVDVPEGATIAYVQIANTGGNDGIYNNVVLSTKDRTSPIEPPVTPDPTPVTPSEDTFVAGGGCATAGTGETAGAGGLFGLLAIAGIFTARRPRR